MAAILAIIILSVQCSFVFPSCDIFLDIYLECSDSDDADLTQMLVSLNRIKYALLSQNFFFRPNLTVFNSKIIQNIDLNQNNELDCKYIEDNFQNLPIDAKQCEKSFITTVTTDDITWYTEQKITTDATTVTTDTTDDITWYTEQTDAYTEIDTVTWVSEVSDITESPNEKNVDYLLIGIACFGYFLFLILLFINFFIWLLKHLRSKRQQKRQIESPVYTNIVYNPGYTHSMYGK